MRSVIFLLGFFGSLLAYAQSLSNINYRYLYNPGESFTLALQAVRQDSTWKVFYELRLRDTLPLSDFSIQWEVRESLGENKSFGFRFEAKETLRTNSGVNGEVSLKAAATPKVLVAKVVRSSVKQAWMFYRILDPNYPVDGYISNRDGARIEKFLNITDTVKLEGSIPRVVSFYNDNFPTALPPFSESQGRVSKGLKPDSTFTLPPGTNTLFARKGLYLVQKDTTATTGFAFRTEDDYPKFAKIPNLAEALVYICTRQEYTQLVQAKNDKRTFDRIILGITNDTDRARKLIRNYFRRVELANLYFTSYKEGWKTDRGMVYIIFGLPEEVFRFSDREVWSYKNDVFNLTFNFSRSSSVFDPDNYVLIRDNKYRDAWYETIDLWRNARF